MAETEKRSVLVIDDDLTIRKLIAFHLGNNNYKVLEAETPASAFIILKNEDIDLVLCDVTMEEMDGYTFCKKVRENEKYKVIPFVFVTANTSQEDKNKALEAGGDDIIGKPFNGQDLLLKVQSLIKRTDIYKNYGVKKQIQEQFTEAPAKILLVDDDVSLSKLFNYNLIKAGFDCKIANCVEDGFAIAKEFLPDIIISDIMMPNVDGFAFRRMLLDNQALKGIPFIFLTSKGAEEDILEGYDLGITDYVIKTAGPKVVVAKVSAIIKSLTKERQKVVSELGQAADSLRIKVVPDNYPVFAGFSIKHWHVPYQGIPGGDFLDYFNLDKDNIAIILGDVMGKKWGAWYFAFAYAGYVRSAIRMVLENTSNEYSPSHILSQVNKSIYKDAKVSEVFATLSIIVLNNKTKELKYSGAGDLPIILKKDQDKQIVKLQSKGLLLGFMDDGMYEDVSYMLQPNDVVLLSSDGIIESRNVEGEQFGEKALWDTLSQIDGIEDPFEIVKERFTEFTGRKFEDDISFISIKTL